MNQATSDLLGRFVKENELKVEIKGENTFIYLPDELFSLSGFGLHCHFIAVVREFVEKYIEFCVITPLITVQGSNLPIEISNALLVMNGEVETGSWAIRDLGDGTWCPVIIHNFEISDLTIEKLRKALLLSTGMVKKLQIALYDYTKHHEAIIEFEATPHLKQSKPLVM